MLRPYNCGIVRVADLVWHLFGGKFFAALRTGVEVFAERNFDRFEQLLFVKAKSLPVGDIADIRAKLSVGPEKISDGCQQLLDFVVALDQLGDVAGGARRANVLER